MEGLGGWDGGSKVFGSGGLDCGDPFSSVHMAGRISRYPLVSILIFLLTAYSVTRGLLTF